MKSRVLQALRPVRISSPSLRYVNNASSHNSHGVGAVSIAAISTTPTSRRPPPPQPAPTAASRTAGPKTDKPARTFQSQQRAASSKNSATATFVGPQAAAVPSSTDSALSTSSSSPSDDLIPAPEGNGNGDSIDWSRSFHGLSTEPFPAEVAAVLMKPIGFDDVEIKPDGIIYLPEIKYRRILNAAFGPGGWGMAPRGELFVAEKVVTREYALVVHGRFIAQARGEMQYFSEDGIATAGEGCKSNALLRCCKDLGVASELWDPRYIREFKKKYAREIWVEHVATKKKRQIWVRKDEEPAYPYKKS